MFRTNVLILTAMVLVLVAPPSSQADVVVPKDLGPGDPYHLVFRSDGSRDALSSDIADYNDFVNDEAAMNPILTGTDEGVEWFAIGSTETTNARDNTGVGACAPVYLLNGTTRVVDGFGDLWDGSLIAPINLNQFLAGVGGSVWTGSTNSGGSQPTWFLGANLAILGAASANSSAWINNILLSSAGLHPLYALSQLLVVPDPDPCPWDLDGDGGVGILDLLALLSKWGPCPGGPSDFDGDGNVGILDLLTLLANWGPCP